MLALRKHFHYSKSTKNNIKSDPGAHHVIWTICSMVFMLPLSQYAQHSKSYKIASNTILELMMHLGVIFHCLDAWSVIASPISKILYNSIHKDLGTRNVLWRHWSSLSATNSALLEGWSMHRIYETLNAHDALADFASNTWKITSIELMVRLDDISCVLDAFSAKAFLSTIRKLWTITSKVVLELVMEFVWHFLWFVCLLWHSILSIRRVLKYNPKWSWNSWCARVSFSMVWMLALPSHPQDSKSFKIAPTRILELVMSLEGLSIPGGCELHSSRGMEHELYVMKLWILIMLWLIKNPKKQMLALRSHSYYSKSIKIPSKVILQLMMKFLMTFSMVCMLALPRHSQDSKSYKIAPQEIPKLMMHLDVIFYGWMPVMPSHRLYPKSFKTVSTKILELVMSLDVIDHPCWIPNPQAPKGWNMNRVL